MIRYDYECPKCDKFYEVGLKSNRNRSRVKCPKCGKAMKQVFLKPIRFKVNG